MKIANTITVLLVLTAVWLFFSGCESTPIQVTPQPNIAAVTASNTQTRKHIKRTQKHIDSLDEHDRKADDKLQSVARDLDELLKQ